MSDDSDVQNLFASARDYATLANRSSPNAQDVLLAHEETSHPSKKLKRESKKRRRGVCTLTEMIHDTEITAIRLELVYEKPEETLRDSISSLTEAIQDMAQTGEGGVIPGEKERTLEYAFEGAPKIPPSWTYPPPHQVCPVPAYVAFGEF